MDFLYFSLKQIYYPAMNTEHKKPYGLTRSQEQELSRTFGKHVSTPKTVVTLLFSLAACASPMLLGVRLWSKIPPIVETGLIGPGGQDDSLPRAVLVFGIPGLFCILDLICHGQLWLHQKTKKIPPTPIRILGRWCIPILSVFLSGIWILHAAGEKMTGSFAVPCFFALALLLLGAHFFDCPQDSAVAFHVKSFESSTERWNIVHRIAGVCWMLAGYLLLMFFFALGQLPWYSAVITVLLLLLHFPAGKYFLHQ